MKLVRQRATSSFWESFSDLIFATMAIFVLLLIIFISHQGDNEPRLEFTGSSTPTYSLIAHANIDGVPSVIFFPVDVADGFNMTRLAQINDPLLTLASRAVADSGLAHLPMSDYVNMAPGLSRKFALGIRSQGEGTIEAALLLEAHANRTGETGEALRARVFGARTLAAVGGTGERRLNLEGNWPARYIEIGNWLQSRSKGDFHSWIGESRTPVREQTVPREDGRSIVEYRLVGERAVRIGNAELSLAQFRGFLASIHAGRDFALIQVNAQGTYVTPPAWVAEQVLVPTGFTAAR